MEFGVFPTQNERPFFLSKEVLDTTNSLTWFMTDALWMLGLHGMGFFFVIPTLLTGLGLLYIEKRRPVFWINLAINCWIWMNTLWMLSDAYSSSALLQASRVAFVFGGICIIAAVVVSGSVRETFSHFRRFRMIRWDSK